jgi:hypothetical protein
MDSKKFIETVNDISNSGDSFSQGVLKSLLDIMDQMSTKDRIIEKQKVTIQNLEEKIRELEGDKNNLKYL